MSDHRPLIEIQGVQFSLRGRLPRWPIDRPRTQNQDLPIRLTEMSTALTGKTSCQLAAGGLHHGTARSGSAWRHEHRQPGEVVG